MNVRNEGMQTENQYSSQAHREAGWRRPEQAQGFRHEIADGNPHHDAGRESNTHNRHLRIFSDGYGERDADESRAT